VKEKKEIRRNKLINEMGVGIFFFSIMLPTTTTTAILITINGEILQP
jgi:hypothetical protein